jgi:large subunit ribosomal protein L36
MVSVLSTMKGGSPGRPAAFEEEPMKVRNSLRALKSKPGAQVVRRHGSVFVINKKEPRLKARQG